MLPPVRNVPRPPEYHHSIDQSLRSPRGFCARLPIKAETWDRWRIWKTSLSLGEFGTNSANLSRKSTEEMPFSTIFSHKLMTISNHFISSYIELEVFRSLLAQQHPMPKLRFRPQQGAAPDISLRDHESQNLQNSNKTGNKNVEMPKKCGHCNRSHMHGLRSLCA